MCRKQGRIVMIEKKILQDNGRKSPRYRTHPGADPAVGKGGGQIVEQQQGFQGAGPLAGVARGRAPCVGKFCISELNWRDLVHTFCQHYIENLLIYLQ